MHAGLLLYAYTHSTIVLTDCIYRWPKK